jgi:small-conductance mechanosensitive channel
MNELLNQVYLNNTVQDWLIAIAIIAGAYIVLRVIKNVVIGQLIKWSSRTNTSFDDFMIRMIEKSVIPFFYFLAVYVGISYLEVSTRVSNILHVAILVVGTFFAIRLVTSTIGYFINSFVHAKDKQDVKYKQARGLIIILNIFIWIVGIIFLVDNLGYDITTVIAGLGIGGIAIALAAQTILGDLFSYFVIFFDKPFEIGDFIIVGDKMGVIEYVGIKTTRIRSLGGEQIIFSNTDLTNSRIHNYKRMEQRRIVFSFGIVFDTEPEKVKLVPSLVKNIIESQPDTRFDRAHLLNLSGYALDYEIVYYVLSADYNVYMDLQQQINFQILEAFSQHDIHLAYPTQTIVLNGDKPVAKPYLGRVAVGKDV